MSDRLALVLFVAGTLAAGLVIGLVVAPGAWYAGLEKPWFTPPNWLFGPAWSVLYVLVGVAGWRAWRLAGDRAPFRVWVAQLALNFAWTPIFFGLHLIGAALFVILLLLALILAFVALTRRRDSVAALLFVPYAAWVGYAGLLNAAIWRLN